MSDTTPVTITLPGSLADYLTDPGTAAVEEGTATCKALHDAPTRTSGTGYYLTVTAPLAVHRELLQVAFVLGTRETKTEKPSLYAAYHRYAARVSARAAELRTTSPDTTGWLCPNHPFGHRFATPAWPAIQQRRCENCGALPDE
ncbi:hypothetical protein [Streptomyces sp. NPDC051546]|uniref:hypothetical protein n=1 Tax=Streptomyces sp. NPDC051546 TaxID=3365655 RepID=UPI0037B35395